MKISLKFLEICSKQVFAWVLGFFSGFILIILICWGGRKNHIGKKVLMWYNDFAFHVSNRISICWMLTWVRKTECKTFRGFALWPHWQHPEQAPNLLSPLLPPSKLSSWHNLGRIGVFILDLIRSQSIYYKHFLSEWIIYCGGYYKEMHGAVNLKMTLHHTNSFKNVSKSCLSPCTVYITTQLIRKYFLRLFHTTNALNIEHELNMNYIN